MIFVLAPQSLDSDNISFDQFVQKYSKRYTSSEEVRLNSNYSLDEMLLGLRVRHELFRTIKLKPLRPVVRGNNLKAKRSGRTEDRKNGPWEGNNLLLDQSSS